MKVVHYLNQFFAGLGGEEAAGSAPVRIEGPVGPGRGLGLPVSVTIACGDDHFGLHEDEALATLLGWIDEEQPHVLVCGPSFGSGRYGYACGCLARETARRGIPVVAAMTPDSPGVIAAEGAAFVVPTGSNVAEMRHVLPKLAGLAGRLGAGESIGPADEEGYLPRGARRNVLEERPGAVRAVELLLSKIAGETRTEIPAPAGAVTPPAPLGSAADACIALVTEAGCVPRGNPDRLPSRRSAAWLRYSLDGIAALAPDAYETVHAGFDRAAANADPNRLVPLDAVRELEVAGRIGSLHDTLYTTSGVDTPVSVAARFGQEIGAELASASVDAVILTGT